MQVTRRLKYAPALVAITLSSVEARCQLHTEWKNHEWSAVTTVEEGAITGDEFAAGGIIGDTSLKDTVKPAVQEEKTMEKAQSPTLLADTAILCYRNEYGVTMNDEANEISYDINTDTVCVPRKEEFTYEEDWYAALCGQLVHSTALESRCARATEVKKLSAGEVSVKEELIAEIGASMVLSAAGLTRKETKTQTAAVCAKWIAEMENDYRLIVTASYGAEKAAKLILGELAQ